MKRGDIYILDIINPIGSIQQGKRPVIIIQNDKGNLHAPTTIVCSITSSRKKKMPTHVEIFKSGGLEKNSTILCEQIFTVDKANLTKYVGTITNPNILHRLDQCIEVSLGLKGGTYD